MSVRERIALWPRAMARTAGSALYATAQRLATFGYTPPPVQGMPVGVAAASRLRPDDAAQKLAESKDARYGRLTYGAGPAPARYSTHPANGITPEIVYGALTQAELTGICWQKADLTLQVLGRDPHLAAVDHTVRTRVSGCDWRIKPYDDSDLALALANYTRSWWDDVDSMDRAQYGLLLAWADGYGCGEVVDAWKKVHFRDAAGNAVEVAGDHPRQIAFVHNKHIRFDPTTDEPMIDVGGGKFIALPRGKVIFHTCVGDGIIERRGHIQATGYLHVISHNAVARWAIYLAQFGLDQIIYEVERTAYEDMQRRTQYESLVADLGNGIPRVMTDEGKLNIVKAPQGGGQGGVHASLIGWANNEKSKRVQGETLTMEVGGNGAGYNTSDTQAQMQDAWIKGIGRALAQDMRQDLVIPVIEKNGAALAAALGASVEEMRCKAPRLIPHTQRPLSPAVMVQVLGAAKNEVGLELDADESRELLGLNPPRGKLAQGRPVTLAKGAAAVSTADVQRGGADNPDPAAEAQAKQAEIPAATEAPEGKEPAQADVPNIELTATDLATIITVNEARTAKGLAPLAVDGELTIAEYKAKHSGVVAAAANAEEGGPPAKGASDERSR